MAKKKTKELLESVTREKKKVSSDFSKEIFLDLSYDLRDKYDKLSNTYAYKFIEKERGDEVLKHLEKFNPTRQLFEKLLEKSCINDLGDVELFKGLNKGTLEKILRQEPRLIYAYDLNPVDADFGVDENTWMRYVLVAKEFDDNGYSDNPPKKTVSFYKGIYEKYFSMDDAGLNKCYGELLRQGQKEEEEL